MPSLTTKRSGHVMAALNGASTLAPNPHLPLPRAAHHLPLPSPPPPHPTPTLPSPHPTQLLPSHALHSSASFSGLLYAIGGYDGTKRLSCAEAFDFSLGEWLPVPSLSTERNAAGAGVVGGRLFVAGGTGDQLPPSHTFSHNRQSERSWCLVVSQHFL